MDRPKISSKPQNINDQIKRNSGFPLLDHHRKPTTMPQMDSHSPLG